MKGPAGKKNLAANLWCWGLLSVGSILALILAPFWLAALRLCGRSWTLAAREGIWLYGRMYILAIRPFVKVRFRGQKASGGDSPAIVVVNHQSWLDLYLLGAQPFRNACLLVRGWPFKRLFFFQPLMRLAGYIETESQGNAKVILDRCREELKNGAAIVCFPEGTRSPDGSLGRFRSGVFQLAMELAVPVVPLIIHHSGQVMPKGSLGFREGRIEMEMAGPVKPELFQSAAIPHGRLRRHVRRIFLDALGK